MVHEYRKLSQIFDEIKDENNGLKNSPVESSTAQLEDTDSLKTELSKLMIENDLLRNRSCELKSKDESYEGMSTQSDLAYDKFKKINFVKASVIHNAYESVKYDDQTYGQLNQKGKAGHFAEDYNRTKKEDRSKRDEKKDDRSKERSKERRMRTRSEKRPNRKNDRKVLVAEESNKNWAESDSDSTSSSSSSSDSEPEEVHCLMSDHTTTEDEVFDFSNSEFTQEDLINALNEMVHEYRKLSQIFEEIKDENNGLKNSPVESSTAQLEDTDSLKTELSKLMIGNDLLRNRSCELKSENEG
ncbi:hypothetical protein F511_36370 [Dorcoceras hygrometricum]|uniref:Uncharacterized protein n=1 Tax=Dorcoceras hygrometricum TaxID=472368 RepID=A0A2Z7CDJ2_9LAMI|nr:hypothetical protein F511_36370 [Dorcoceras hygrometricum]